MAVPDWLCLSLVALLCVMAARQKGSLNAVVWAALWSLVAIVVRQAARREG